MRQRLVSDYSGVEVIPIELKASYLSALRFNWSSPLREAFRFDYVSQSRQLSDDARVAIAELS